MFIVIANIKRVIFNNIYNLILFLRNIFNFERYICAENRNRNSDRRIYGTHRDIIDSFVNISITQQYIQFYFLNLTRFKKNPILLLHDSFRHDSNDASLFEFNFE